MVIVLSLQVEVRLGNVVEWVKSMSFFCPDAPFFLQSMSFCWFYHQLKLLRLPDVLCVHPQIF